MLFLQLAENNCRPMGTSSSPGLPARIYVNSKPPSGSKTLNYEEQSLARRGNTKVDKQRDKDQTNRRESGADLNSLQKGQRERITVSKGVSQTDWQDDSSFTSCPPSSIVVQRASTLESSTTKIPLIRDISEADPRGPSRVRLVGIGKNLMTGKNTVTQGPDLVMETDASLMG